MSAAAPAVAADSWPIECALEILDEEGFDAVTLRAVAARGDRTPMAVYRHLSDVDELLTVMVRRVFEHWESRVYTVTEVTDPVERLRAYAAVYRKYAERFPHRYDLLFVHRHGIGTHRFPDGFRDEPATTFRILRDAVAEAMEAGRLPDDDPVEVALMVWATAHGLVMIRRSGRFAGARDAFVRLYEWSLDRLLGSPAG